jgi:hypothetical protein
LEVNSRKSRNPALMRPITETTRASVVSGRLRENSVTAKLQPPSISVHSKSEPSCEPHVAAMR